MSDAPTEITTWRGQARARLIALSLALSLSAYPDNLGLATPPQAPNMDPKSSASEASPALWRRVAGTGLAVAPGLLLSGGGHWLIGREREASRLFWLKLGALGAAGVSGFVVARSGASDYVTPWGVPLLVGSGLGFMSATLLDLVGVWSSPQAPLSALSAEVAPALRAGERMSLKLSGGVRESSARAQHSHWALDWAQQRGAWAYLSQLSAADEQWRAHVALERALSAQPSWGSWLRLGFTEHVHGRAGFKLHQLELTSRWTGSLGALIGPSLSALRAELWLGWSGGLISYPLGDLDGSSGVLGGLTLSHHSLSDRLRVQVGYDHRHDDWVGGAVLRGVGSGVLGGAHLQIAGRLSDQLWLSGRGSWGAARLYTLSLGWGRKAQEEGS